MSLITTTLKALTMAEKALKLNSSRALNHALFARIHQVMGKADYLEKYERAFELGKCKKRVSITPVDHNLITSTILVLLSCCSYFY